MSSVLLIAIGSLLVFLALTDQIAGFFEKITGKDFTEAMRKK